MIPLPLMAVIGVIAVVMIILLTQNIPENQENMQDTSELDTPLVWAVMVPMQKDGGGEWVMPEIPVWFGDKDPAYNWAHEWSKTHVGDASVLECKTLDKINKNNSI